MKTRNGFVSNSSSSSFIVPVAVFNWDTKRVERKITDEQEQNIIDRGYIYTKIRHPSIFETRREYSVRLKDQEQLKPSSEHSIFDDEKFLGYGITCNQDDELEFLCKAGVEFIASCHYNQETVISDGENIYFIPNPGIVAEMYKDIEGEFGVMAGNFKVTKEKVSDYLKSNNPSSPTN